MVGCNSYRQPSLLAKITSTVDVISGGRLDWGIGAGWYENEYKGYGFDFPPPRERIGRLRECVEIVPVDVDAARDDLRGKLLQTAAGELRPEALQQPHPPIWIGGGGEQLTLRVVARLGDCPNFGGQPEEWRHKREVLREPLRRGRAATRRRSQDVVTRGVHPLDGGRGAGGGQPQRVE